MMYELVGPGATDVQGDMLWGALLYDKTRSERLKKAGVLPGATWN